jgi:hypothetical protein
MKKFSYVWAAFVASAALVCSCSSDSTEDDASDGKAAFLTYGFYAEDNAGLTEDYVAEVSTDMVIRLPEGTDKTALVARFTTSENDVVLVSATEQVSGQTPNDFTYPVDYVVKDEAAKLSASYTVRVGKILKKTWTLVATYGNADTPNKDFAMCISPKDNYPKFFMTHTVTTDASSYTPGFVAEYNGSTITAGADLTTNSEGTAIAGASLGITADASGKIYVGSYNSGKLTDGSYDRKAYVWAGNGSTWEMVGGKAFGCQVSGDIALGLNPTNNQPVAAFRANAAVTGALAKRDLSTNYFDGSAWTENVLVTEIGGKTIYFPRLRNYNNDLYLGGFVQGTEGTFFIYKYANGGWEKVVNALPENVSQPNIGGDSFSIALASDGTWYVCTGGDDDATGVWGISVYKYAPGASGWTRVATMIYDNNEQKTFGTSTRCYMDLYQDRPVVMYRNTTTSLITVVSLNAETLQWDEPITLGSEASTSCQMRFTSDGVGYIAFLDQTTKELQLYKYDTEADDLAE